MSKAASKGEWALQLKVNLRRSKGLKTPLREYKLASARNVGFGYYFPEHIKVRGDHHDYYSSEFAEFIKYVFDNLEDIVEGN